MEMVGISRTKFGDHLVGLQQLQADCGKDVGALFADSLQAGNEVLLRAEQAQLLLFRQLQLSLQPHTHQLALFCALLTIRTGLPSSRQ